MDDTLCFVDCTIDLAGRIGEAMGEIAERHLCLTDGFTLVALAGDRPVGILAVCRRTLPEPLSHLKEGFINIIEVADDQRRRGIGRTLVTMAGERCRSRGWRQMRAWSADDRCEALCLWAALGFALCPATVFPRDTAVQGYFVALPL